MSEPIDPNNKYGIRGYNGLFLKICRLMYPDRMGCGAEKSCIHTIRRDAEQNQKSEKKP